jgi:hypothetical protein
MGLKRMLSGNWFVRVVMITWIICAVSIFVLFKNMELIVHGQLYSYGLQLSPDWADPYRLYTWLIYICLGLPTALSGLVLVSSFLKVEKAPEAPKRKDIFQQRLGQPRGVVKLESTQIAMEAPRRVENINGTSSDGGISCPNCEKVFSRPLVMPDFHGDTKQLVSVCPYCYHILRARQLSEIYNE